MPLMLALILLVLFLRTYQSLSLRDIRELLLERDIDVSHETICSWPRYFGTLFAKRIKKRLPRQGDKIHVDEMRVVINKEIYWLWRDS